MAMQNKPNQNRPARSQKAGEKEIILGLKPHLSAGTVIPARAATLAACALGRLCNRACGTGAVLATSAAGTAAASERAR